LDRKGIFYFLPKFELLPVIGPEKMELIKIANCSCFHISEKISIIPDYYSLERVSTALQIMTGSWSLAEVFGIEGCWFLWVPCSLLQHPVAILGTFTITTYFSL
jgi:hypothetical protein